MMENDTFCLNYLRFTQRQNLEGTEIFFNFLLQRRKEQGFNWDNLRSQVF